MRSRKNRLKERAPQLKIFPINLEIDFFNSWNARFVSRNNVLHTRAIISFDYPMFNQVTKWSECKAGLALDGINDLSDRSVFGRSLPDLTDKAIGVVMKEGLIIESSEITITKTDCSYNDALANKEQLVDSRDWRADIRPDVSSDCFGVSSDNNPLWCEDDKNRSRRAIGAA